MIFKVPSDINHPMILCERCWKVTQEWKERLTIQVNLEAWCSRCRLAPMLMLLISILRKARMYVF